MKRVLLFVLLLSGCRSAAPFVPVMAPDDVLGTLTWTLQRPDDLTGFSVAIDGAAPLALGLPVTNSAPLSLALGSHSVVLAALYADGSSVPALPVTVNVTGPAVTPTVVSISPDDGVSMKNNTFLPVNVVAPGFLSAKLHWIYNGSDNSGYAVTKTGDTFSAKANPTSGPGVRTWYWELRTPDGQTVKTPIRSVNVTSS